MNGLTLRKLDFAVHPSTGSERTEKSCVNSIGVMAAFERHKKNLGLFQNVLVDGGYKAFASTVLFKKVYPKSNR
jgi:hypothetical protein